MQYAAVGPIAIHLPEKVETNDDLQAEFPNWNLDLIYAKTGIRARHIAAPDDAPRTWAWRRPKSCSPSIDRPRLDRFFAVLHANARLSAADHGLPGAAPAGTADSIGALDFNLGCSGFVYGLSLADGLIRSGAARRVLLITAETYSKYIAPSDRSLRTIFGDGSRGHADRSLRHALALGFRLRHRRQRRRRPVRSHRRRSAGRRGHQTAHQMALAQQALHGRSGHPHPDDGHHSQPGPAGAGRRQAEREPTSICF